MSADSWDASGPAALLNERYRLRSIVSDGGTATVYRAEDRTLGRTVAVKILRSSHATRAHGPQFAQRFRDAASAAAMLNHPNIVTIFDIGDAVINGEATPYVVMEFVGGMSLRRRLRKIGLLTEKDAVRLMLQICSGVAYAHKRGVVHGSITAEHVLLARDGRAKVTSFGAPKAEAQGDATAFDDVYALGALLFEMLHGHAPGDSYSRDGAASASLAGIIKRATAADPARRYRNADHFASALAEHLRRSEPPPNSAGAPSVAERVQARTATPAPTPAPPQPAVAAAAAAAAAAAVEEATIAAAPPAAPAAAPAPTFVASGASSASAMPTASARAQEPGGLGCGVILLAIAAVLSVLGLIPLYAQVYLEYTRPPQSGSGVYVAPTPSPAMVIMIRTEPPPAPRATQTAEATTALVGLPTDLIGRPLDDALRSWFAERKLTLVERSAYGVEPEGTIVSVEPDAPSVREGGAVTVTTSSGGRVALDAQLGDAVVIESARFTRDEYRPGMTVQFEVTWRALRPVGRDYRVFVHLHDVAGNFIAQTGDRAPENRGAPFPTAAWSADTVVVDTYELPIPLDAQPGLYEIRVGLYDDNGRLPVTRGDAERVKANGVVAGIVRVQ